jgi:enoyl-CoA hydratase/carnithine racemase
MLEWGFLNKIVPSDGNYLMEEAMVLAEKLTSCGPKSQQGIIKLNRLLKGLSLEEAVL